MLVLNYWFFSLAHKCQNTCPIAVTSTPLGSIDFTVSRPGATNPLLHSQFDWMTSRLSWLSRWLSMLRQGPVDKNDDKPCQIWELTRRSATLTNSHVQHQKFEATITSQSPRWISAKKTYCLILVLECSSSFTSSRKLSAVLFFPSCFHPISMTLLERCTGLTLAQQN